MYVRMSENCKMPRMALRKAFLDALTKPSPFRDEYGEISDVCAHVRCVNPDLGYHLDTVTRWSTCWQLKGKPFKLWDGTEGTLVKHCKWRWVVIAVYVLGVRIK